MSPGRVANLGAVIVVGAVQFRHEVLVHERSKDDGVRPHNGPTDER